MFKVTSSVLRFVHNIKSKFMKNVKLRTGYLISKEYGHSETWLKYEQILVMFDRNWNCKKLKHYLKLYEDKNTKPFVIYRFVYFEIP